MRRMTVRRMGAYGLTVGLWGIALLLLSLAVGVMFVHIDAGEPGGRRVPVSEPLFSGLRISTVRTPAGLRIGSARYASRRAGLFVIGNTRRLILEDVDLVFGPDSPLAEAPEDLFPGEEARLPSLPMSCPVASQGILPVSKSAASVSSAATL